MCDVGRDVPGVARVSWMAERDADPSRGPDHSDIFVAPGVVSAKGEQRRIKVLVVIPSLCVGGAETDLVRNLPLVDRTRFEIVVCTFLDRSALAGQLTAAGIEVIGPFQNVPGWWLSLFRSVGRYIKRLMTEWKPRSAFGAGLKGLTASLVVLLEPVVVCLFAYPSCVRPIAHLLRAGKFDVIHAVLPYSYLFSRWANRLAGQGSLIMSRVSQNWYHESDRLIGFLERYALHPGVNTAVCNSEVIARELQSEGIPKSKIRVIYNGIDLLAYSTLIVDRNAARAKLGVGQDHLVFSSVANLFAYKGHADLLQALHKISARLPHSWTLLVAGRDVDGNLARLIDLRNRLGLAPHVRLLGERLDVPIIFSASDIHVSASHTEGLPNNVLEAMSCGLPVVATAVGGVPELVIDNVTGLLVPARDVDALGTALLALADDSECRRRMGRAAHERIAACFPIQRSVAAFERLYRDALIDRPGSHAPSKTPNRNSLLHKVPDRIRLRWPERKPAVRGIVVMVHEVNDGPENHVRELATGLTAQSLDSIVAFLRRDQWDIVTIEEALVRLKRDDAENRFAVLTFDDGYRDTLTRALPILERHDAPFTVYIPTGAPTRDLYSWWLGLRQLFRSNERVDIACMEARFECRNYEDKIEGFYRTLAWVRGDYRRTAMLDDTFQRYGISLAGLNETYFMNESDLRLLARHPLASVGAHTASHGALSLLSVAEVQHELVANRRYLEGLLDRCVVDLAYPYGHHGTCGRREFALAAEAGFRSAVTTRYGAVTAADRRHAHALPRVAAGGEVDFDKFASAVGTLCNATARVIPMEPVQACRT